MDKRVAERARLMVAIQEDGLHIVRTSGRSLTEYYVLQILAFKPGTTGTQIAERLALVKSSVSFGTNRLSKEGLVKRSEHSQKERRTIALSLTRRETSWMQRFWRAKAGLMMETIGDRCRRSDAWSIRASNIRARRSSVGGATRAAVASDGGATRGIGSEPEKLEVTRRRLRTQPHQGRMRCQEYKLVALCY